jgi:ferric-dicitrate binding protein FerR (iron transport regulator)
MKKEDLIIKWLDNNLDENELKAFKQLDASSVFIKIDEAAQRFKAPSINVDQSYQKLKNEKTTPPSRSHQKRFWIGVAAALVLSLGLYFSLQPTSETTFFAQNTQKLKCNLPDASEVILNAGSQISFQTGNWDDNRQVQLEGEAYFKVAKGSKFTVNTTQGAVEVLGTQFSVNSRADFFAVICYEGVVQVNYRNSSTKLTAGNSFNVFGNDTHKATTPLLEPSWIHTKSSFISVPFSEVVRELERQYNIKVAPGDAIDQTLFTGSFTHENLETALQAITIPLNLSYTIEGNKVMLKSK